MGSEVISWVRLVPSTPPGGSSHVACAALDAKSQLKAPRQAAGGSVHPPFGGRGWEVRWFYWGGQPKSTTVALSLPLKEKGAENKMQRARELR